MKWARSRLAQLVLALVFVLGFPSSARAQPQPAPPRLRAVPDEEVSVLAPPPPAVSTTPAPDIAAPPDLTPFLGRPLTVVDVVLDDARWLDEHPPVVTEMRG